MKSATGKIKEYPIHPLLILFSTGLIGPNILFNLDATTVLLLIQAFPEFENGETDIGLSNLGKIWANCHAKIPIVPLFKDYLKASIYCRVTWAGLDLGESKFRGHGINLPERVREDLRNSMEHDRLKCREYENAIERAKEKISMENDCLEELKEVLYQLTRKRNESVGYRKNEFSIPFFPKQSSDLWLTVGFAVPTYVYAGLETLRETFMMNISFLHDDATPWVKRFYKIFIKFNRIFSS